MDLEAVLADMNIFAKYYDVVRIVEPRKKQVIASLDKNHHSLNIHAESKFCYDIWSTGGICLNCISMRAALENSTFVKFQAAEHIVYMITAIPLYFDERVIVLELYKHIASHNVLAGLIAVNDQTDFEEVRAALTKLNESAVTDELTKIHNRRWITERLPIEILKSSEAPCSIIMADIDYFKKINDAYGHMVGDEILKAVAAELSASIRQGHDDWIARFGGEEFLLCLSGCDNTAAYKAAERMRQRIEATVFKTTAGAIQVTASFGVYTFSNYDLSTTAVLDAVDQNLYKAKNSGRNRVVAN